MDETILNAHALFIKQDSVLETETPVKKKKKKEDFENWPCSTKQQISVQKCQQCNEWLNKKVLTILTEEKKKKNEKVKVYLKHTHTSNYFPNSKPVIVWNLH